MRIFVRFDIFEILFFKELFRVFAVKKRKKKIQKKTEAFGAEGTEFGRKRGTHYSASILRLRRELFRTTLTLFFFAQNSFFRSFFL